MLGPEMYYTFLTETLSGTRNFTASLDLFIATDLVENNLLWLEPHSKFQMFRVKLNFYFISVTGLQSSFTHCVSRHSHIWPYVPLKILQRKLCSENVSWSYKCWTFAAASVFYILNIYMKYSWQRSSPFWRYLFTLLVVFPAVQKLWIFI